MRTWKGAVAVRLTEKSFGGVYGKKLERGHYATNAECMNRLYELENVICDADGNEIISLDRIESQRPVWTPCADRLPDEAKPCYITTKRTLKDGRSTVGVLEGYLFKGNWFDKAGWKIKNWDCEAIAWQYNIVPEPYNPDRKEDAK
jgi:hypothetical protein